MIKYLLTVLFLLHTLSGYSQTETGQSGKWKIGLMYSQDFYQATSVTVDGYSGYNLEPVDFNFTTGLIGQFTIKPNFKFITGVTISQKSFTGTFYCVVCRFLIPPQPEPIKQLYMEVPVLIRYNFFNKKLGFSMETGLLGGYRTNDITTQYVDPDLVGSKYLISGQVGIGASYDIGQHISLSLGTVYRRSLKEYSENTDIALRSVGLTTGVSYKLN